jgi:hypothetical protein
MTKDDVMAIYANRRRVSLSIEELDFMQAALAMVPLPKATELREKLGGFIFEELDPERRRLVDAYRAGVRVEDGVTELDDDAEVSMGEDDGAYVQVWTWVSNSDAGLPSIYDEDEDGQNRESYTDDQDRDSYTVSP